MAGSCSTRALAARLPYARRLAAQRGPAQAQASLAGIALALRALAQLLRRAVAPGEIVFAQGEKPRLAAEPSRAAAAGGTLREVHRAPRAAGPDFSIAHAGPWVACAAVAHGRVGLDVELGTEARIADWVVREAALKATGEGLRALGDVRELESGPRDLCWRGERWHLRRLDLFPGASACVLTSRAPATVEVRAVTLAELLPP